jgi:hypothetical protein
MFDGRREQRPETSIGTTLRSANVQCFVLHFAKVGQAPT